MYLQSARRTLIVAFSVAVAIAPGGAQTVQGILVGEKDHLPIGKARVELVDDSGRVATRDITDSASGAFYLDAHKPGRYKVRIVVGRGGLSYSPAFSLDSNQTVEHMFAAPDWPSAVLAAYLPEDVTKKAAPLPGNRPPRYPDALRAAERSGFARVRFVINPDGRADLNTFRVVQSDDEAFTRAVRDFVERVHFAVAERDGVTVPQVFEMAVDFGFGTEAARATGDNVVMVRALGVVRRIPH
jgi:TonB family protein